MGFICEPDSASEAVNALAQMIVAINNPLLLVPWGNNLAPKILKPPSSSPLGTILL